MSSKRGGKVITFYSYKGGTGRTMALVNMAWVLAGSGQRVLLIDWDLEAPGLHHYFRPFMVDKDLQSTPGLVDYFWDVAKHAVTPQQEPSTAAAPKPLEEYVVGLNWKFEGGGSISLVPAGRQDETYAQRVNTFDWDNFYERLSGGKWLHLARDALRDDYDYILIDSRTGVSDTSGICTVQMPDSLVLCFTLNRQSICGAAGVAASVQAQRGASFRILPVPTRLENAETDKLATTMAFARRMFAPFLLHVQSERSAIRPSEHLQYWNDVKIPYKTFYAFEEVPAAFKDEHGSYETILAAVERLAKHLTDGRIASLPRVYEEEARKQVVDAYALSLDEQPAFTARPPTLHAQIVASIRGVLTRRVRVAEVLAPVGFVLGMGFLLAYQLRQDFQKAQQDALSLTSRANRIESERSRVTAELAEARSQIELLQDPSAARALLTVTRPKRESYAPGPIPMGDKGHLLQVNLEAPGPIRDVTFQCTGPACGWVHQCPDNCSFPRVELEGNKAVWRGWSNSGVDATFTYTIAFVAPTRRLRCQAPPASALLPDPSRAVGTLVTLAQKRVFRLSIDVLPSGAVVPPGAVADAVKAGALDCGVLPKEDFKLAHSLGLKVIEKAPGFPDHIIVLTPRAFDILKPALETK